MKIRVFWALMIILATFFSCTAQTKISTASLKTDGAVGFPQKDAEIIVDNKELKLSFVNSDDYLLIQAIVWQDNDDTNGLDEKGLAIGDRSSVTFLLGSNKKRTPHADRVYLINPWPDDLGLNYQILRDPVRSESGVELQAFSVLQRNSLGKGQINHIRTSDGKIIRVDTYLIPLAELGKVAGDNFPISFYAASPKPDMIVSSMAFSIYKKYYDFQIPLTEYKSIHLKKDARIDVAKVLFVEKK